MEESEQEQPFFEVCTECGSNIFKIKVVPFGECGSDNQFICAVCSANIGGVYNDPLGEGDYEVDIGDDEGTEEVDTPDP